MLFLYSIMKQLIALLICLTALSAHAQEQDKATILRILDRQTEAWNAGDIDKFMVGYWSNDSLMYIGKNGVTYGYNATLNNYKRNYSNRDQMGQLKFTILHVNQLAREIIQVVGKWQLTRTVGNVGGHFTLIFKRIHNEWVIISDHSS